MATAEPPEREALPEPEPEAAAPPAVMAVVVTRNPGPWLEQTLDSLSGQDYPRLTVLVVDAGSEADPTPRVTAVLPGAFVRRAPGRAGFGGAANEALGALDAATFLLACHDDVVLDPTALRLLVEEAYRSNAGIVGPKLVEADNPQVLLEVGRSIDRYGAPHTGIEPGELDQEQHDGVRDVFYVSGAAMLVRADLFRELGGFDPATFPGAEDLDLCWRARLAGARVLVAPDARVRHRQAADERGKADRPDARSMARSRVRTLLTSYSLWTLVRVVPIGLVLALGEAVVAVLTRQRGRARAALGAWWWNARHLGDVRRSRRRAQALRRIQDGELRELQVRGSTQIRSYLSQHLHAEERLRSLSEAGRSAVDAASAGTRQPIAIATILVVLLFLLGSRDLVLGRVPAVGTLARWPGVFELLEAYASGWRYTGMGSPAAAPPAFAFMAALGAPLLGAVGLARTLVVVGALPLGAAGAYRLARARVGSASPAVVAGLVYAVNPVPRNALAGGRLGPLVLYALAPFLLATAVRVAEATGRVPSRPRLLVGLVVLTTVATAFFPPAPLWLLAATVAVLLAAPFVGGAGIGARMLGAAVLATLGALVLLLPWPLGFFGADAAGLGFAFRPRVGLGDVLRFHTGPSGAGWTGVGLLAAAALSLVIATGARLAWAGRAWMLALVGFALVWAPARWAPDVSVPAPEAGLSLAALGLALATGLGAAALLEGDLRRFRFGWRQPIVALAGVAVLLPALGFAADSIDGRWHSPGGDWDRALGFLRDQRGEGGFRVLWVGDPAVLPLDPMVLARDGIGYVLTRNGPGDGRELWRAPQRRADRVVGEAVELAVDGRSSRLGHLVAPMGVRYIAVPDRPGPKAGASFPAPAGRATAVDDQTDLARLGTEPGIALYENQAWAPTRSVVDEEERLRVDSKDPLRAALRAELAAADAITGPLRDSSPAGPGTVLWSEAYDGHWEARAADRDLAHVRPFGVTNGYVLPERAPVSISYGGQPARYGVLALQGALWVGLAALWWRTGPRRENGRHRRRAVTG